MGIKRINRILCISLCGLLLCSCGKKAEEEVVVPVEEPAIEETQEVMEEPEEEVLSYDIIPDDYAFSMTVSINPLVELYFDKDNTNVGIAYLNQDALDTYKDVEVIGKTIEEALEMIINAASESGYIKSDSDVSLEIAKVNEDFEESFDAEVLIEASKIVDTVIEDICNDNEIEKATTIEVSVSKEIEEKTGVKTPTVCSECNGTGNNCKECNGTTIVNCKRCVNGVESCGTCHGSAIITCHGCHGAGGNCSYCGGSGKMACDACGGQGTFLCSWCKGELRHICPECWGEGTCPSCGGDGIL